MWLFSSTHRTTAFSGGSKYSPTISRTFSTKNGSVESLKCFCRCGSNPKACQMRCTVDFDTRVSAAICRILQCVPPFGFVSSVLRTNCATRSSLIGRGRPGRNSSCNPATSYLRKRRRHLPTVALVSSNCRAICRFVLPEALSKIILARITNPAGRDRELAKPSSCSRCSGFKTKAAFGRPIAIGTPILHWRYLNSQQYYCHLFMGHYTSSSVPSSFCLRATRQTGEAQGVLRSRELFVCASSPRTWKQRQRGETVKRQSLFVLDVSLGLAIVAMVGVSAYRPKIEAGKGARAIEAAFRDGLYQAKLDVQDARMPRLRTSRWGNNPHRAVFIAGYEQGYREYSEAQSGKLAEPTAAEF